MTHNNNYSNTTQNNFQPSWKPSRPRRNLQRSQEPISLRSLFEALFLSASPPRTLQSSPELTPDPRKLPYCCSAHPAVSIDRLCCKFLIWGGTWNSARLIKKSSLRTHSTFSSSARWHARNSPSSLDRYLPRLSTLRIVAKTSSMKGQWQKRRLIGRGTLGSVYLAINRYIC